VVFVKVDETFMKIWRGSLVVSVLD